MSKIHFTGTHYRAPDYYFQAPGDYEVTDDKAKQLLQDFPDQFSTTSASEAPAATKPLVKTSQPVPVQQPAPSDQPNFRDMKRAELNAYAKSHGVGNAEQLPNIDAVIAAIEVQTKDSNSRPKE